MGKTKNTPEYFDLCSEEAKGIIQETINWQQYGVIQIYMKIGLDLRSMRRRNILSPLSHTPTVQEKKEKDELMAKIAKYTRTSDELLKIRSRINETQTNKKNYG